VIYAESKIKKKQTHKKKSSKFFGDSLLCKNETGKGFSIWKSTKFLKKKLVFRFLKGIRPQESFILSQGILFII